MDPQEFSSADVDGIDRRDTAASLLALLGRRGLPARLVPIEHAWELRDDIERRFASGELDQELYAKYAGELTFDPPVDFADARSILVAAVPRPQTAAVFHFDGGARTLPIPPTYSEYDTILESWTSWLGSVAASAGCRIEPAHLPLKLLAAKSGLAAYGRNNITFVPGLGSFYELVAAFTNIASPGAEWHEPRMLERCLQCRACVARCPTAAIRLDRFLIDAGRCLVFHNEREGSVAFPDWIDPSAHRAVIGCMECQRVCPENRAVRSWTGVTEEFSEAETAMLLAGTTAAELPPKTLAKLEHLDAVRFLSRLPRNLRAALSSGGEAARP